MIFLLFGTSRERWECNDEDALELLLQNHLRFHMYSIFYALWIDFIPYLRISSVMFHHGFLQKFLLVFSFFSFFQCSSSFSCSILVCFFHSLRYSSFYYRSYLCSLSDFKVYAFFKVFQRKFWSACPFQTLSI